MNVCIFIADHGGDDDDFRHYYNCKICNTCILFRLELTRHRVELANIFSSLACF